MSSNIVKNIPSERKKKKEKKHKNIHLSRKNKEHA